MADVQSKGIVYESGQLLGKNEVQHKYIEEAERYVSSNPKGKGKAYRKAVFECGYCSNQFTAPIHSVKSGRKKSCGCIVSNNQALILSGNGFAKKFTTKVAAKGLLDAWLKHRKQGLSPASFTECDAKTFERVARDYPDIFTDEKLYEGESEFHGFYEKNYILGMTGKLKEINPAMMIFAMKNNCNWTDAMKGTIELGFNGADKITDDMTPKEAAKLYAQEILEQSD